MGAGLATGRDPAQSGGTTVLIMGVDIGQRVDPTAVALVEQKWRKAPSGTRSEEHFTVRHLERLPLDTPYPQVAERIEQLLTGVYDLARRQHMQVSVRHLNVDATGVGSPLVDFLRAALVQANIRVPLRAVYFTHGDKRTIIKQNEISLGKAWLVSRLQALLQSGRLHLPNTPEARQLALELQDYEIRVDENANDKYGAFRVGTHDDLVTALGLAVQETVAAFTSASFR